jgi:NADPH-dependent 2,4-dienoyl-CoA reductase/sulfur reductase-like enzyme
MHVLVVGASLGGLTVARALRAHDPTAAITLLGEELDSPYDRPPLSKQLLLDPDWQPTGLADPGWYRDQGVELRTGSRATGLDPAGRVVHGPGWSRAYDRLVIATGARARRLPPPLHTAKVRTLRTRDDAVALKTTLRRGRRLAVLGAGFIGMEVAAAARQLGLHVTVVDPAPAPMSKALGLSVGIWFRRLHERHGVDLRLARTVESIDETSDGCRLLLDNGETVEADVVLAAVGAIANGEWTHGVLEHAEGGIRCDHLGRSSDEHVWAVGDVAAWYVPGLGRHVRIEHWATAVDHAQVVAAQRAGHGPQQLRPPSFWSDQYDAKARFVGYPGVFDEVELVDRADGESLLAR